MCIGVWVCIYINVTASRRMCPDALTTACACAIHSGIIIFSCFSSAHFILATLFHLYGFQLPAALFALVRIFFHAIFFRPKKHREGRRSRAEECASHSLSRSHSLSSILSLPSRQYGDCSLLATLILRDRNFYLESDFTEEQPFLHDI